MAYSRMLNYTYNTEVANAVEKMFVEKSTKRQIKDMLTTTYGYSKSKAYGIIQQIADKPMGKYEVNHSEPAKQSSLGMKHTGGEAIEQCGAHVYNKKLGQFVWTLKDGSHFVARDFEWKNVLNDYKNGASLDKLSAKYTFSVAHLREVFAQEKITHDTPAITSKDMSTPVDENVFSDKRAKYKQDLEKEQWKQTQADAEKWRDFQFGTLDIVKEYFSNWSPEAYVPKTYAYRDNSNDEVFVIGLSDLHFGAFTSASSTFSGKSYSTKQAAEAVEDYLEAINAKVNKWKHRPSKAVVLVMGDILHTHSNNGMTTKGTQLKFDVTGPEQLDAAVTSLTHFLEGILNIFNMVEVHSVRGNHSGNMDYALGSVLQAHYRLEPRLVFHNHTADHALVKIGSGTLAIITHGASDEVKAILPSSDAARQNWALNLFTQWDGNLTEIRQKLLFSADQHHIEVKEYASFTHYMFPTAVKGDHYAESKGLNNRAAQLCLLIDSDGVADHMPIYL